MIRYDMIFIYCNWISTRWQWSVDLYKNRKETAIYKKRNSRPTQKIQKNTEYTKYKTNIKRIFKNISQVIRK